MFLKKETTFKLAVGVVGFTAMITQIIMLRELLSVFHGNELIIGIALSNWMLLTGIGAYLGKFFRLKKNKIKSIIFFQVLTGILPLATVFVLNYFRNDLFLPGILLNPFKALIGSFLLLAPFCIISGMLFTVFSKVISELLKTNLINKIYALEAVGSIVGGLLVNIILLFYVSTFWSLYVILMINLLIVFFMLRVMGTRFMSFLLLIIIIVLPFTISPTKLSEITLSHRYRNQDILIEKNTPYGNILVTNTDGQINFYENGIPLFSTDNVIACEESVHYAMVQHNNPENILLISGGISGTIKEVLKYKIKRLDYVEINPDLVEIGKTFTQNIINDPKLNIITLDARRYIKKSNIKYDVVLINIPDPSTVQLNRFYTLDFLHELRVILNQNAVVSMSLMSTANYLSPESKENHAVMISTLKQVFENVIIINGYQNFFLASDNQLSHDIINRLTTLNIKNEYVNLYYIDNAGLEKRSKHIESLIGTPATINTDFKPVTYYLQLKYWLSMFKLNYTITGLLIISLFLLLYFKLNILNKTLFITGFSATSAEIIILISAQVIYGIIFYLTGVIITIFMIGLALGAAILIKMVKVNLQHYSIVQLSLGFMILLIPIILYIYKASAVSDQYVLIILSILVLIIGMITGLQFALGSKLQQQSTAVIAAKAYSSDLMGSALGAFLVSSLLIPYFGIINISIGIGILNLMMSLFIRLSQKSFAM